MAAFTRRSFLGGAACAVAGYSFGWEPLWLDVTKHRVSVPGLPESVRIAQVTDAHLGHFDWAEEALVHEINRVAPDIVVLTGDLIDDERQLPVLRRLCAELRAPSRRLLATLGNWEHWGGIANETLRAVYEGEGVTLLVNETVTVRGSAIGGTDDATGGKPRPRRVLRDLDRRPSLLLTHSPGALDRLPSARVSLTLAGHTHGGQINAGPWNLVTPPGSGRFVAGLYSTPVGAAYVSRGTGTSIAPARLCARPELPIFDLERA